MSWLFKDK